MLVVILSIHSQYITLHSNHTFRIQDYCFNQYNRDFCYRILRWTFSEWFQTNDLRFGTNQEQWIVNTLDHWATSKTMWNTTFSYSWWFIRALLQFLLLWCQGYYFINMYNNIKWTWYKYIFTVCTMCTHYDKWSNTRGIQLLG